MHKITFFFFFVLLCTFCYCFNEHIFEVQEIRKFPPQNVRFSDCYSGNVFSKDINHLVLRNSKSLFFFDVIEEKENFKFELPISSKKLCITDLNDNEIDEIVFCSNNFITKLEWNKSKFIISKYEIQYEIHDYISGDINNDGIEDLVLACLPENINKEHNQQFTIIILNFINNKMKIIAKSKIIRIQYSPHIPSDKLICIADIENTGINQIIISNSESCVPSYNHKRYSWDKKLNDFNKEKLAFPSKSNNEKEFVYFDGILKPFNLNGKTYVFTNQGGNTLNKFIIIENSSNNWNFYPIKFGSYTNTFIENNNKLYFFTLNYTYKKGSLKTKQECIIYKLSLK